MAVAAAVRRNGEKVWVKVVEREKVGAMMTKRRRRKRRRKMKGKVMKERKKERNKLLRMVGKVILNLSEVEELEVEDGEEEEEEMRVEREYKV